MAIKSRPRTDAPPYLGGRYLTDMALSVGFTFTLVAWVVSASLQASDARQVATAEPPLLPAVTKDVLPGEGWIVGTYKLRAQAKVFNTWKAGRRQIATAVSGATFALLSGLSEVSKPDLITVTGPIPELGLNPGDKLLRFTARGEGNTDFWANGYWRTSADFGFVKNADRAGVNPRVKRMKSNLDARLGGFACVWRMGA